MKIFNFFKLLIIFILGNSYLFAFQNVTYNRTNFSFLAPPNENAQFLDMYLDENKRTVFKPKKIYWEDLNPNKNKFLFMYFMDIYCPFTAKNIPQLQQVLAYIKYYYPNLVKPILIEALPRNWLIIKSFLEKTGLTGLPYYMSPNMDINTYLNVNSTPTVILMDPYGNIVDKINSNKLAPVYITHLDYIIGQYLLSKGITDINGIDTRELVTIDPNKTLQRIKDALVDAGMIREDKKLYYSNEELNPFENNPKEEQY